MPLATLQSFLLWSALVGYGTLLLSFVVFALGRKSIHRMFARRFGIDHERFDAAAYLPFGLYRIGLWLLFLVPYLALCIVRAMQEVMQ